MVKPKQCDLIEKAISLTCEHPMFKERLMNKWITDSTLVRAINSVHVLDKQVVDLDTSRLNKSLTTNPKLKILMDRFDGVNNSGLYRVNYCGRFFYYLTSKGNNQVSYPPVTTENEWVSKIELAQEAILWAQRMGVASAEGVIEITSSPVGLETPTGTRADTAAASPTPKRLRLISPQDAANAVNSQQIATQSFWESPEATKLFCPKEDDNSVEETLQRRVKNLSSAVSATDGWRNIVEGPDPDNLCSDANINSMRQRCMLLCQAYLIALKRLVRGHGKSTWKACCDEACAMLNPLGITQATNPTSIERHNLVH